MKLSSEGEAFIKGFEELRLTVYPDIGGIPTGGWGHTGWYSPGVPMAVGQTLMLEQAQDWFSRDVAPAEAAVIRLTDVALTQGQFDALVSFAFNEGCGALEHSTLLRYLNQGMPDRAAAEFLRWDRAAGREVEGLERRRRGEQAMFLAKAVPADPPAAAPRSA